MYKLSNSLLKDKNNYNNLLNRFINKHNINENLDVCIVPKNLKTKITFIKDPKWLLYSEHVETMYILRNVQSQYRELGLLRD